MKKLLCNYRNIFKIIDCCYNYVPIISSYRIVSNISAYVLKEVTQPDVIAFEIEYATYSERINDINQLRLQPRRTKVAFRRQYIQQKFQYFHCIPRGNGGTISVEEASEEMVKVSFGERLQSRSKELADMVECLQSYVIKIYVYHQDYHNYSS